MHLNPFAILCFIVSSLRIAHGESYLRLTALISTEDDHKARFECWEVSSPFSNYPTVGQAIPGLADVSNVSYVVLPPRSTEGLHKPPHAMQVHPTLLPIGGQTHIGPGSSFYSLVLLMSLCPKVVMSCGSWRVSMV